MKSDNIDDYDILLCDLYDHMEYSSKAVIIISTVCIAIPTVMSIMYNTHSTISEFSASQDLSYLFLFSSSWITCSYILMNDYDVQHKVVAMFGLLIMIPARGDMLSIIHTIGVIGVVIGSINITMRDNLPFLSGMLFVLSVYFMVSILNNNRTETSMVEYIMFITCLYIIVHDDA